MKIKTIYINLTRMGQEKEIMQKKNIVILALLATPLLMGFAQAQDYSPKNGTSNVNDYSIDLPQPTGGYTLPLPNSPNDLKKMRKSTKFTSDLPQPRECDYSKVTDNPKIIAALNLMYGTAGEWSREAILGNNISNKPIKVLFKDLSTISPAYADFDALGWKESKHQLVIFINLKHRNAPPEALACLLSHEAIHQDEKSSITEETFGWTFEATEWLQLKDKEPELSNPDLNIYPLVQRMNKLEKMYEQGNYTDKYIRQAVAINPGYKDLPETSPGFGE